jgi:hypothetical protein
MLASLAVTTPLSAQTSITVDQVACVPVRDNAVLWATVTDKQPGASVRLYFRRLNDVVEDLYFVTMLPSKEANRYWAILPKPEKRKPDRHEISKQRDQVSETNEWAIWWREKEASTDRDPNNDLDDDKIRERASRGKLESRHWMNQLSPDEFQKWLEGLQYEPVEYYAAVAGTSTQIIAQTPMMVGEVRSASSCKVELTPEQLGEAANLVVGETAPWQVGEPVFHWMCEGVVTRLGENNVKRADESCRSCVPCISQAAILTGAQQGVTSPSGFE